MKRKLMMIFYAATWVVALALPQGMQFSAWHITSILIMAAATFICMYLAAKESRGKRYANRNLLAGLGLCLLGGIGFILWPPLVRSEIGKFKGIKPV